MFLRQNSKLGHDIRLPTQQINWRISYGGYIYIYRCKQNQLNVVDTSETTRDEDRNKHKQTHLNAVEFWRDRWC